jgi:hypothetical protein
MGCDILALTVVEAAGEGFRVTQPENVANFERPSGRQYQVSLNFSGEAGAAIKQLMVNLGVDSPNEVAKRAIAFLLAAQGKEVLLKDPKTGDTELIQY